MEVLSTKTVLLVTHQVDFLPAFDSVLVSISHLVHLFRSLALDRFLGTLTSSFKFCILVVKNKKM